MNQLDFNIQLFKQLCNIQDDAHVSVYEQKDTIKEHQPLEKQQRKSVFYCKICDDSFCLNKFRNCMTEAHFNLV